jgi:hypothetical protein
MQNAMKNISLQIAALDNLNADEEFANMVENHKVYIPFPFVLLLIKIVFVRLTLA